MHTYTCAHTRTYTCAHTRTRMQTLTQSFSAILSSPRDQLFMLTSSRPHSHLEARPAEQLSFLSPDQCSHICSELSPSSLPEHPRSSKGYVRAGSGAWSSAWPVSGACVLSAWAPCRLPRHSLIVSPEQAGDGAGM